MSPFIKWGMTSFLIISFFGCYEPSSEYYYKAHISIDVINESDQSVEVQALSNLVLDENDQSALLDFDLPHESVTSVMFEADKRMHLALDCQHENFWSDNATNHRFSKVESFALKVQINNQVDHYFAGWPEGLEDDVKFEQYGLMYIESPCNSTKRYNQISELDVNFPILKMVITPTYEVVFYIEDANDIKY